MPIQLAIFLNAAGHYGNASTTEDLAEWAGVSVSTVYNCFCHVMITVLQHHDDTIHFDPMEAKDQEEIHRAKVWVERKGCFDWRNGFLCVDGSPFNLFQKPGWHGEGFYDRKSRYSLSSQVVIMPHNLRIIDYMIGVPGSLHDSTLFSHTQIFCHPQAFLSANEWIWVDTAYPSLTWCIVPFKKPSGRELAADLKFFNYHLSSVSGMF
ncbi:hypothetical protein SCLCIDRAFT_114801 [Scleroderma citrinum Foug A]|uniref:DDE Tnp4 domain-containing protein n=1 Tax=Scleroderma citrinum Foug A TaxID=1036808 RepID=A0A0C3DVQ8_9AGAM|nr:hypothetical protein SCLCIDRAFT_114801 [Scleroderma citrinum Foug A]